MSDTPRVDSVITGTAIEPHDAPRLQHFARALERELADCVRICNELREDKERLDWIEKHGNFIEVGHCDIGTTRAEIDAARATPAKVATPIVPMSDKQKIEELRKALQSALALAGRYHGIFSNTNFTDRHGDADICAEAQGYYAEVLAKTAD